MRTQLNPILSLQRCVVIWEIVRERTLTSRVEILDSEAHRLARQREVISASTCQLAERASSA